MTFLKGQKHGKASYHHRNGSIQYQMNYQNDTLHGSFTQYFKSGRKASELTLNKGRIHGHAIAFNDDANSTFFAEGDFLMGEAHGIYTRYIDAHRKMTEVFSHGLPIENRKIYYNTDVVAELVLDSQLREYTKIMTYKKGIATEEPILDVLRKDFMYGKFLVLPQHFK